MKEIVLHLKHSEIRLNESVFVLFFVKPLFLLLIYFGFYSRTQGLLGISGGQLSVLISFTLFSFSAFHFIFFNNEKKLSQFSWLITIFFVITGVIPLFTAYIFGAEPMRILRFSIEVGIVFFMFFSIYYFIREGIISIKFFLYALAILGFIASIQILTNLIGAIHLRRLRGMGGSNYLGSSYALAAFTWVFIIYSNSQNNVAGFKKYAGYFCLFITVLALLLTGTRAAAMAFVIGIMLFQVFGMQSKKFTKYMAISGIVVLAIIFYVSLHVDLTMLLERYSYEQLSYMAAVRFEIYALSLADLTLVDFLFGRPDYYLFSETDDGINTHNLFLSIIRYTGIIPFILFMGIFVLIFQKYLQIYLLHRNKPEFRAVESTIIILFIMIFIYTMFSGGRFTRSFALYIILGYAVGYFELLGRLKSYDEYKKLLF